MRPEERLVARGFQPLSLVQSESRQLNCDADQPKSASIALAAERGSAVRCASRAACSLAA